MCRKKWNFYFIDYDLLKIVGGKRLSIDEIVDNYSQFGNE